MLKWAFWDAEEKQDYAKCFAIIDELREKGLSLDDIAYLLDISVNKVRKYAQRSNKKHEKIIQNITERRGRIKNVAKAYTKARDDAKRWRFRYSRALEKCEAYRKRIRELEKQLETKEREMMYIESIYQKMAMNNTRYRNKVNNTIKNFRKCQEREAKLKAEMKELKKWQEKFNHLVKRLQGFKLIKESEAMNMLRYYEERDTSKLGRVVRRIANKECGYPLIKDINPSNNK